MALLQNSGGQSTVVFIDLNNPDATPKGVIVGDVKARNIVWVDDEYILVLASVPKNVSTSDGMKSREFWRWISISKAERKLKILFKSDAGYFIYSAGHIMATTPEQSGSAVIARMSSEAQIGGPTIGMGARFNNDQENLGYSLFRVDMKTGRDRITYRGNIDTEDWIVDSDGEAILRIDYDDKAQIRKIFRRRKGSKTFELISEIPELRSDLEKISIVGLGDTPSELIATTFGDHDKRSLVVFNTESGEVTRTLFRDEHYDVDSVTYDSRSAKIISAVYVDDMPRAYRLIAKLQELQNKLTNALPHAAPLIASFSADYSKLIVRVIYTDRPDDLYLFDELTNNLSYFSTTRPAISDRIYAEKTKFDYVTPDGFQIKGYLTTPPNTDLSNLPLIVLPHSGSADRDDLSFDWWAFFYAARGYAVYQPNFRGSGGYGRKFREAGNGEWGRKMQDDLTNGVNKLVGDGIIDPSRICIVGRSYGGYAALVGATLTPDLYACAVSVNGISDIPAMIGEASKGSLKGLAKDYWEVRIGSRFKDTAELNAISPAKNAENVQIPIMLMHGIDDVDVPSYQSKIMSDALTAAGKPHEFIELEGADHWLSSGDTRTEMLRRSIEFIDRHIGE
ncbi:MAG: S9 family peptidase [Marinicaulis sp.]|nr:S9 family peptidase [Marinicaulis sp.]